MILVKMRAFLQSSVLDVIIRVVTVGRVEHDIEIKRHRLREIKASIGPKKSFARLFTR